MGALLPAVTLAIATIVSDEIQPPAIDIPRIERLPALREIGADRGGEAAAKVTAFVQREPQDGAPASEQTEAYLSYDDSSLHVVFICRDRQPGDIRARLTKREGISGDDSVVVVLDTFHDRRRGYVFLVNPLGVQMDGIVTDGQPDDYQFDALWRSEGRLTPDGYIVRIEIPFRSLRFSGVAVQQWGVALGRIIPRKNETSFWPHIDRNIASFGQQLATMSGLRNISPSRNMQVIPYAAFAQARFLDETAAANRERQEPRIGLDAKMVVREAFTVDVAVNPEFSQIESDEPQVTVNQRFEQSFPEKRPFFIENSGYFRTAQNLFFSRRIADPELGVRITGKQGGWALGGLVMDDTAPAQRAAEPGGPSRAWNAAFRLQRDLARQSHIGALVTSRSFGGAGNQVGGFDGRWRFTDHWTVSGQAVGSTTRDAAGDVINGSSVTASLNRTGRGWTHITDVLDRTAGFRSQLGFIPRVDIRQLRNYDEYKWRRSRGALLSFGPTLNMSLNWNHAGEPIEQIFSPGFGFEWKGQTRVSFIVDRLTERIGAVELDTRLHELSARTAWFKWLETSVMWRIGSGVNYVPAGDADPFIGASRSVSATATVRPAAQLRVDQTYIYTGLSTRDDAIAPAGTRIFANHLARTKVHYQLTRALSGRIILDYSAVLPTPALIALTHDRRLSADVLVTYLLNPWTALHVGVAEKYANLDHDPLAPGALRRIDAVSTRTSRQVFVKFSYLVRF